MTLAVELGPVSRPVVVRVDDPALGAALAHLFGADPPAPPATEPVLVLSGSFERDGVRIEPTDRRAGDLAQLVEELDAAVDQAAADDPDRGFLLLHASAVEEPAGRALVFAGSSGAGKSTQAGLFALAGSPFLGDECLALAGDPLAVLPWRRPLAIRSDVVGWLDRHPERGGQRVSLATERKRYLPRAELGGAARQGALPIATVVWLDRHAEREGPAAPDEAFRVLLAGCHCFDRDGFHRLAELARSVPIVRVRAAGELGSVERIRAWLP